MANDPARLTPGLEHEEPDLWNEDDIPSSSRPQDDDEDEDVSSNHGRETPLG